MKNLLILDKESYKARHNEFISIMNQTLEGENRIIYTSYEDDLIRKVRNYKVIGSFLQHVLYWIKSYKYAKKAIKMCADNIFCINPIVGIFLGLFNRKSRIVLTGFLFEPKKNQLYYKVRKSFTKNSLKGIDKVIVYGSREVKYYEDIFHLNKFMYIPYGIDFDEKQKYNNKLPSRYIFSGGGSNRDYETLIKAYNFKSAGLPCLVIATQPWRIKSECSNNITIVSDAVVETFGDVLSRSELLVLSLNDTIISAGHMVMFQAMALGIPILVNDIPAIRDYVDESQVVFYESKNTRQLNTFLYDCIDKKSELLIKAKNAKEKYNKELTFSALLKRVLNVK